MLIKTPENKANKPAVKRILFIMVDQLRWDYLSCYGHKTLETPNIDALAARGVIIETTPVVELLGLSPSLEAVRLADGRTGGRRGAGHRREEGAGPEVGHDQPAGHPRQPAFQRLVKVGTCAGGGDGGPHDDEHRNG